MGRSFIRFVNHGVINQTQDPAARMDVDFTSREA
jgi:hypothetical protein